MISVCAQISIVLRVECNDARFDLRVRMGERIAAPVSFAKLDYATQFQRFMRSTDSASNKNRLHLKQEIGLPNVGIQVKEDQKTSNC